MLVLCLSQGGGTAVPAEGDVRLPLASAAEGGRSFEPKVVVPKLVIDADVHAEALPYAKT